MHVCDLVCPCVHGILDRCVSICVCLWRQEEKPMCLPYGSPPYILRQGLSLKLELQYPFTPESHLPLPLHSGIIDTWLHAWLLTWVPRIWTQIFTFVQQGHVLRSYFWIYCITHDLRFSTLDVHEAWLVPIDCLAPLPLCLHKSLLNKWWNRNWQLERFGRNITIMWRGKHLEKGHDLILFWK